ncbi:MAG: cytochrome C oxidase subunit IV family protein [Myxococcaceae bacterium]
MAEHHDSHYVKVWGVLVFLLVVSVLGPLLEIPTLTLITAFGIALVKAFLVAKNFMHLNIERRWVLYLLGAMIGFMVLMVAGISPDVMRHKGQHWDNVAAQQSVERGLKASGHPAGH